jgi:filamentous hemagglutinin
MADAAYLREMGQSTKGSKKAIIVEVKGHSEISQIQVHPGGGRHGGQYYKISTSNNGLIKVVDRQTYSGAANERAKIIFHN